MSFRTDLADYLLAQTPITAFVGTRIKPQKRDQGSPLPAITFSKVSGSKDSGLQGSVGHCTSEMQFDIWSLTELQGEAIVEALRGALAPLHGAMGGTIVDFAEWGDDSEYLVDESGLASDTAEYHFMCSVTFHHSESIPTFA